MSLDELILAGLWLLDDVLPAVTEGRRLRQRGPLPTLTESEVLTSAVVGASLGVSQEKARFTSFRRHWTACLPARAQRHRTSCVRQAANRWASKERLWERVRDQLLPAAPSGARVDRFPLPVCQFARASRCRRFQGEARDGQDQTTRQPL